jgi:glycosyltransferase involved in cell wall biosynthesis
MLINQNCSLSDSRISNYRQIPKLAQQGIKFFEREFSTQSRLSPTHFELKKNVHFQEADIVHYQVIHDGHWFRIEDLEKLARIKPSVWTWHDAWPVTGHCIQPLDCSNFSNGCNKCPHLEWPMALKNDRAAEERKRKARVIRDSQINIHVSTEWMKRLILSSEDLGDIEIRVIPFGIDTQKFQPGDKLASRKKLRIHYDSFVIGLRTSDWVVKNTKLFEKCLEEINSTGIQADITVVTFETPDMLTHLIKSNLNLKVVDLGWVSDHELIEAYQSLDVFLGISTGESFGFMPIEAAACGAVPIAIHGTAVAEFVEKISPKLLISNSSTELTRLLLRLMNTKEELRDMRAKCESVINSDYNLPDFLKKMIAYYREIIKRDE